MEEIEAPVGYALDDTVWNISISKAVGLQINAAADSYEENTDLLTDAEGKEYTQTLIFENEAVYSLPETGGRGILLYTISGMLMMMGGALFLFLSARKRTICK